MVFGRRRTTGGKRGRRVPPGQWIWSPHETHPAIVTRQVWDAAQVMGEQHGTSRDGPALSAHPQARRTYLLRGMVRCRPCQRRIYGTTRPSTRYYTGGQDVDHAYYRCPHDPGNPAHRAQAPGHPASVSVREDLLLAHARQFFAARIFGPDRAALLREQLPASAAEESARREKEAARLRTRLKKIDTTEDAHVREVQALAELDPNAPAVKAMRERHLRAFTGLEAARDQINGKLAALAKQAGGHGGDPGLLDDLPLLGDALPTLPDRIKQQLFEAFDLAMLYHKTDNQVTCRATITPATPAALAAIVTAAGITDLAAYLHGHASTGDLSRHPG
jgi:site-specific DNA recombinase